MRRTVWWRAPDIIALDRVRGWGYRPGMQIIDEKDVIEVVVEAVRGTSGSRVDSPYTPNRYTHPAAFHIATLLLAERQKHLEHMLEPHPAVYQLVHEYKSQVETQAKEIAALKDQLARARHFVMGASAALSPPCEVQSY